MERWVANGGYSPVVGGGCDPQTIIAPQQQICGGANISLESGKLFPNLDSNGPSEAG
jgi:hypothetical protein